MSETGDYLRGIFNGEIPVKRKNPQTGETENVYYKYDDDREGLVEIKNNNQKINIQSIFDDIIPIVTPLFPIITSPIITDARPTTSIPTDELISANP